MAEDLMNFDLPVERSSIIKVLGIGGGGSNAVNHMYRQGIKDVNFVVCNTDAQALNNSPVPVKIQIGESLTEGRGAGNKPDIGRQAAIENLDDVMGAISSNTKMVFITAGMGGGTGTGAAPVIARAAREAGILTVAIVTIPFRFEGPQRINQAIDGLNELKEYVDSLLVINNEKLREMHGDLKLSEAFSKADNILTIAAKGIAEIITVHGYVNVDFADVETVMTNSGVAIMGSGKAEGENRAIHAIQEALNSPLLNSNDITGANSILLNITSGENEISMDEIGEITDYVNSTADDNALIIWGTSIDHSLDDAVTVTIIATGFEANSIPELYIKRKPKDFVPLNEYAKPNRDNEIIFERDRNEIKVKQKDEFQGRIEFDMTVNEEHQGEDAVKEQITEQKKTMNTIQKIKKSQNLLKEKGLKTKEIEDNIDELEDEPAYVRKNIKIKQQEHSSKTKVSKYSLQDEDKKETKLKSDNAYLHDNVD
ncbi:MAG: cell division protein FtsZ [Bacteroidales bacterium]|nr:MAG: cell division protein FtsZ [Bacteroidales bacterium]